MLRTQILVIYNKNTVLGGKVTHFKAYAMSRDFFSELVELNGARVHVKNKENVNKVIGEIVCGGTKNLQVVSDFDGTITKQHENGKPHLSSFGIFARCRTLPKSYLEAEQSLTDKYFPIEVDPTVPFKQKRALMEEWWSLTEKLLIGLKVPQSDIDDVVSHVGPSLRDNCVAAFKTLDEWNVPVLVFSAGLGDAVEAVLKHYNVYLPNIKVISNFLKRDAEGTVLGFKDHTIHVFNKNEKALEGTEYYELVRNRSNIILLGDSLGDVGMASGVPNSNAVLKIGFLYNNVNGNLPGYMDKYDIVLEDDQSMDVLNALLSLLK